MYQPRQLLLSAELRSLRCNATEQCNEISRSPNGWSNPTRTASTEQGRAPSLSSPLQKICRLRRMTGSFAARAGFFRAHAPSSPRYRRRPCVVLLLRLLRPCPTSTTPPIPTGVQLCRDCLLEYQFQLETPEHQVNWTESGSTNGLLEDQP